MPEHNSEAEARAAWNRRATPVNASMGEDGATWTDEQHAAAIEALTSHKWLDPECHANGCQSLVWKRRYESAVKGRSDFRQAYREARSSTPRPTSELVAALRAIAWMPSAIDDRDGLEAFNEARRIARAALTQTSGVAASLPTAGAGVGVKPLEWDEWNEARTPFGKYHAYPSSVHFEGRSWAEDNVDNPDSKAAAQEIHDAAIRSALTEEQG